MKNNHTLTHHGILGQRWGIRRYQNPDGTLTEVGKKRYSNDVLRNHQKSKKNRVDDDDLKDPNRWVEEDISRVKNIADSSKYLTNELKNLERNTRKSKDTERFDLSKMSDKELRDTINREILEKQYNDLFNKQTVSRGKEYVQKTLEVSGSVLGVTSSSLAIALAIKQLKG